MYINTTTLHYPISEQEIRLLYPNTSFPVPFVPPPDYAWVMQTPIPTYDWITQGYREIAPTYSGGTWHQTFEVYSLTPTEIAINEESNKTQFISDAKKNTVDYLDEFARTRDYSDADRCCGYSTSGDPQLANDGAYMIAMRDDVVVTGYAILNDVKTGAIPVPTMEWYMEQLPPLEWPTAETWPAVGGDPVL